MLAAKQTTLRAIEALPEDTPMAEVLYRVHVIAKVFAGYEDAQAGRLVTTEELLEQVETWGE